MIIAGGAPASSAQISDGLHDEIRNRRPGHLGHIAPSGARIIVCLLDVSDGVRRENVLPPNSKAKFNSRTLIVLKQDHRHQYGLSDTLGWIALVTQLEIDDESPGIVIMIWRSQPQPEFGNKRHKITKAANVAGCNPT